MSIRSLIDQLDQAEGSYREAQEAVQREAGEKIRQARHAKGWTLQELAEMVGVSVPHMSQVENGNVRAGKETLRKLCDLLE